MTPVTNATTNLISNFWYYWMAGVGIFAFVAAIVGPLVVKQNKAQEKMRCDAHYNWLTYNHNGLSFSITTEYNGRIPHIVVRIKKGDTKDSLAVLTFKDDTPLETIISTTSKHINNMTAKTIVDSVVE